MIAPVVWLWPAFRKLRYAEPKLQRYVSIEKGSSQLRILPTSVVIIKSFPSHGEETVSTVQFESRRTTFGFGRLRDIGKAMIILLLQCLWFLRCSGLGKTSSPLLAKGGKWSGALRAGNTAGGSLTADNELDRTAVSGVLRW